MEIQTNCLGGVERVVESQYGSILMSPDAVALTAGDWALFLDVDGTLLEVADTPGSVHVPEEVKQLLIRLTVWLDGAVALVSGRCLDDIDCLFAPLRFCAAGVHGCELRESSGCIIRAPLPGNPWHGVRAELESLVLRHEQLLLEDKQYGLALHFRRAPHLAEEVCAVVERACRGLGSQFMVQAGKCVVEIRPKQWSKGTAIAALMGHSPFVGRTPIYIGDDLTDEYGFQVVNDLGGVSIKVGDSPCTLARYRLAGVSDVIRWLDRLPQQCPVVAGDSS